MKLEDEIEKMTVNPPIGMTAAQLEFWLMGYNACLFRVREYIKQTQNPNVCMAHTKCPADRGDTVRVYDEEDEEDEGELGAALSDRKDKKNEEK